ncbi:CorA metal ion transporter [Massospora cicadina]|nr:CorA metal ion transporter [Massospora cicadina]
MDELLCKWLQPANRSATTPGSPTGNPNFLASDPKLSPGSLRSNKDTVWVYLFNPLPSEIQRIGEASDGPSSSTIEDILMQETRDKCEIFPSYYVSAYSLSEFRPASNNLEIERPRKGSLYSPLPEFPVEASLDLNEEYGSFDVCSFFNVVSSNVVVTFHYGNLNLGKWLASYLRSPTSQFEADWINCMILKRITARMDAQLSQLEKQVDLVDDFYLVGDLDESQPCCRSKGSKVILPARLDQLRAAVQLFDELIAPKAQMLRRLAQLSYQRAVTASHSLSFTTENFLELPAELACDTLKRGTKDLLGLPPTFTSKLSPRLSPLLDSKQPLRVDKRLLPEFNSSTGERIVTLFLNLEGRVTSLRVAVAHIQLVADRAFDLQRAHVDLAMTYRSIRQSNAMAEYSGWTWWRFP